MYTRHRISQQSIVHEFPTFYDVLKLHIIQLWVFLKPSSEVLPGACSQGSGFWPGYVSALAGGSWLEGLPLKSLEGELLADHLNMLHNWICTTESFLVFIELPFSTYKGDSFRRAWRNTIVLAWGECREKQSLENQLGQFRLPLIRPLPAFFPLLLHYTCGWDNVILAVWKRH